MKADLLCTDNGKVVTVDVLEFNDKKTMRVLIGNRSVINLEYVAAHKLYVGSSNGYEFTCSPS